MNLSYHIQFFIFTAYFIFSVFTFGNISTFGDKALDISGVIWIYLVNFDSLVHVIL